jgi:hypothetical protein
MKYFHQFIVIICNPKQLYYSLRKKIVTLFKEMKFFVLFSLLKIRTVTFYDFCVNLQICSPTHIYEVIPAIYMRSSMLKKTTITQTLLPISNYQ